MKQYEKKDIKNDEIKNENEEKKNSTLQTYIENYGCQMNLFDNEIVASLLLDKGFSITENLEKANIILINTCSIREKAESTLKNRLQNLKYLKKNKKNPPLFGILGCLSKQIKKLDQENIIDFSISPDSYRKISDIIIRLINENKNQKKDSKIFSLHKENETYSDITPYQFWNKNRKNKKVTAFLSITRGCDNMCTFCVVPFTRGRERSSDPNLILKECKILYEKGYKEVTLLGQNVDSYLWGGRDFLKKQILKKENKNFIDFSILLDLLAKKIPSMRIRFSTSNPHDMSEKVIEIISKHSNICNHIHLPVQSGSNKILKLMNRKYTRESYISLIKKIREKIPECSISHDIMTGFCHENEKDHQETISLMNNIKYNYGYMFSYSHRPGTYAYRKFQDNVPENVKKRRLKEIIHLQRTHSIFQMKKYIGKIQEVLIEGESKKNHQDWWYGRNTQNIGVVFPKESFIVGDLVHVQIINYTSSTLIGRGIKIK
ncbi:tRNA (N6-isopentenyl adenosine(37)-C2)-methylthiotransferase MiaB [Blattabacterium cuenoti]|uniref:tRNA (N6-isopentenyl adenosine(37)-C2)-methylthiotransferase MiaB n=1 Tax=Blattabacterium cuenoti TaxID=1653831 RepID=UPI00163C128B|nr:tRNA (N6-isopentenyl adenosine(37)-C2)-methylthiotransferase MiaB [Blattabacterium cuenoti]